MSDEEKFEKIIEANYRQPGEPIDIARLIKIVEKLDALEAQADTKLMSQHGY